MMKGFSDEMCPKCHYPKMRMWDELTDEQKFLVERLPMSKDFSIAERKRHRFCPRCWFESFSQNPETI